MTRWKIAIVGAGYMAQEHAKAFASLGDAEIVGVCSRTRSWAEALASAHATRAYDNIAAMYARTNADAVVVAVNELSMPDIARAVFAHPWMCLLEKPVGINVAQAQAILQDSHRTNTRAFVALNRRSYSATRQALAALVGDDGKRLISILDQEDLDAARLSGQPEEVMRHWMYANSIHLIDYFRVFGRGEIVAVDCIVPWIPERPGFVVATLRYSSGDIGVYQAIWDGPGPWSVTVTNRQMRLELRPVEKLGIQRRGERSLTEIAPDSIDKEYKPGLRYQAQQFMLALSGAPTTLATLEDATRSMILCENIYHPGRDRSV